MTRAWSIDTPSSTNAWAGGVDAKYRIDRAIADIERLRQEIQMAPSEHELVYLGILGF